MRSRALVLGSKKIAHLICRSLEEAGIASVAAVDLGSIRQPVSGMQGAAATDRLREFLKEARTAQPSLEFLHPGTTLWAERPELQTVAAEHGFTAIAPPARILSLFQNKLNLITEAQAVGIPNLLLQLDPLCSQREVQSSGLPFPYVIKSVRGEANLTIFVARSEEDIERRLPLWLEQLRRNVGQTILFAERYIESSRFIVVPFARDVEGETEIFPLIDASLQSSFKKLVEFCPAQGISKNAEARIADAARKMAEHIGYVGVGTFEFFADGAGAYFLGGSPRLNSEFHLWESVAGTNAAAWQLAAMNNIKPPSSANPAHDGCGIAIRIRAEDPLLELPQPGLVFETNDTTEWDFPQAHATLALEVEPGIEILSEVANLPADGTIASLWITAKERPQALAAALQALESTWIAGSLQTNERFLHELLSHPFVREGAIHTAFVDEEFLPPVRPEASLQQLFAAVCAQFSGRTLSAEERWVVGSTVLSSATSVASLNWEQPPMQSGDALTGTLLTPKFGRLRTCAYQIAPDRWQVRLGLWFQRVRIAKRGAAPKLSALVSGRVHALLFQEGAAVPAHEPLIIVESLRALVPHAIPREGTIARWLVRPEQSVRAGDDLAEISL